MFKSYKDFPVNTIKNQVYHIYPRKGIIQVDGFKKFKLKELKKISINKRLSLPPEIFNAIRQA